MIEICITPKNTKQKHKTKHKKKESHLKSSHHFTSLLTFQETHSVIYSLKKKGKNCY